MEKRIREQNKTYGDTLARYEDAISFFIGHYALPLRKVRMVLCPIKCAYSADYHVDADTFYAIAGAFNAETIMHEFLHPVVHPFVLRRSDAILAPRSLKRLGIDDSYYLGQDDHGKLNAFEEYMVRMVSAELAQGHYEIDLDDSLSSLLKTLS